MLQERATNIGRKCKMVQPLWKIAQRFLKQTDNKNRTTTWSSNPISGCPSKRTEIGSWRQICTVTLFTALFTVATPEEQLKCSDLWADKEMWPVHIIRSHSAFSKRRKSHQKGNKNGLADVVVIVVGAAQPLTHLRLCNPMDCGTPGFPVLHCLLEFAQTHVPEVSDAIQPSHPLLSPSPPVFNLSQHQGLFKWVSSSHQVGAENHKILELPIPHQPFQSIFRVDFL